MPYRTKKLRRGEQYPDWVQRIAEEERNLQGFIGDGQLKYNVRNSECNVHCFFIWADSRQGRDIWEMARRGHLAPLKRWCFENGTYTQDKSENFLINFI